MTEKNQYLKIQSVSVRQPTSTDTQVRKPHEKMGDMERAAPTENDPLNTDRSSSSSSSSTGPDSARHHHHQKSREGISLFGVIGVALAVCLVFLGSFMYISSSQSSSPTTSRYGKEALITKEIMLFGDSLLGVPDSEYKIGESLENDIEQAHPEYDTVISISVGSGNTAFDQFNRIDDDVLNRKSKPNPPQAMIILMDSQIVDVSEVDAVNEIRSNYNKKLDELLGKVKSRVQYVALAGPVLKGEQKDHAAGENLDMYEEVRKGLAKKHDVAYIDLREKLQAGGESGHTARDGETSRRKAEIIEEALKDQILSWEGLFTGPTKLLNNFKAPPSLKTLIKSLQAKQSHAECVRQAGEKKCLALEKAMKAANEQHLSTIKLESGEEIALEDEVDTKSDPKSKQDVEEAIEMDRETQGTFKNVDYEKVKERVKEDENEAAAELSKKKKKEKVKKNSKTLRSKT